MEMSKILAIEPYQGRVSTPFLTIISIFLDNPNKEFAGYEIFKTTKLKTGTVYPLLAKLEHHGWLESEWETENPTKGKRPRLLYSLTIGGRNEALKLLREYISPNIDKCFDTPVAV